MRLYLKLSANRELLPYTYQQNLTGAFHKWLGVNQIHDGLSLYSFSWLEGGQANRSGLRFPQGACWFISTSDDNLARQLLRGMQTAPEVAFGMAVTEVTIRETPDFSNRESFAAASPIFIKRSVNGKQIHYSYNDAEADHLLTETLQAKLNRAGIADTGIQAKFDRSYPRAKTRIVTYKGIRNKANVCPVILEGAPETIGFAWNVGLGNSTGIGFGALR